MVTYSNLGEFLAKIKQPTLFKFMKQIIFFHQHHDPKYYQNYNHDEDYHSESDKPNHDEDHHSKWHTLPNDILSVIINLLNITDFTRMSYACKSWRRSLQRLLNSNICHKLLGQQHPWLLLPHGPTSKQLTFVDLFERKSRTIKLPHPAQGWCFGSSKGWLFMAYGPEHEPDHFMVNPTSGRTLSLPPMSIIPGYTDFARNNVPHPYYNPESFFKKFEIMSKLSASSTRSNCIVAGLLSSGEGIALCEVGGDSWALFGKRHEDDGSNINFIDILFSIDGTTLYVLVSPTIRTISISLSQAHESTLHVLPILVGIHTTKMSLFQNQPELIFKFITTKGVQISDAKEMFSTEPTLVETNQGKLLEIHRIYDSMPNHWLKDFTTTGFLVFSVNPDNGQKCKLNSLGDDEDDVIFWGVGGSSFSLSSQYLKHGFIRTKCIYFLEDWSYYPRDLYHSISREIGIFDLLTRKIKRRIPGISRPYDSHMIWFTPNPS